MFKNQKHVFNRKASLTFEEVLFFYENGKKSAQTSDAKEKADIEDKVFARFNELFPERRQKMLNWEDVNKAFADAVPLEVRAKILGEVFKA